RERDFAEANVAEVGKLGARAGRDDPLEKLPRELGLPTGQQGVPDLAQDPGRQVLGRKPGGDAEKQLRRALVVAPQRRDLRVNKLSARLRSGSLDGAGIGEERVRAGEELVHRWRRRP